MNSSRQYCTFYLGRELFGVDVQTVQEVIRYQEMTPVPLSSRFVRGLINLRGQIVTAIETREHLGMEKRPPDELPMNVVVRTAGGTRAVSFLVDRIGDVVEVEDANFEPVPDTIRTRSAHLITGVYKLDGQLLLVLNTERALEATASAA